MLHSTLDRTVRFALISGCLLLAAGAATSSCAGNSAAAAQRSTGSSSYLPLAVGNRWELRSRSAPDPMVLEVTGRDGDDYVVRWVNPWIRATFRFRPAGNQIVMSGLDMGGGNSRMPANTVYWDFGLDEGQRWQSPVGTGEVSDRGVRVDTSAGNYRDAIEVRTIDNDGMSMYWTFAPNVGLVRWGQGRDAYLLTSFRQGVSTGAPAARPNAGSTAARPAPRAGGVRGGGGVGGGSVLIGLDATPHSRSGGGKRGKLNALAQAFDAGMTLLHSAPKWNEFERSRGRYDLPDDADAIGEFAAQHNLPIALNIRIVDTNQRSMPKDYQNWSFDDQRMIDRLRAAIRAFPESYKRQTRYLAIGNEIDGYFGSRRNEIGPYATLMRGVLDTAREEFPNAQFTVNFTFGAVGDMGRYRSITDLTEFASFTYYPLNGDFTMRPVSDLRGDVDRMLDAAGGRRLYIQEIGYASAERLDSSPREQAEFYASAFDILREHQDRLIGATFLFMSDLSKVVVDYLGQYYKLPNSANFKAYLQTLGLLGEDGSPKPAWDVFRREALAMKNNR